MEELEQAEAPRENCDHENQATFQGQSHSKPPLVRPVGAGGSTMGLNVRSRQVGTDSRKTGWQLMPAESLDDSAGISACGEPLTV